MILPEELEARVADVNGAAYFMDASQVGICRLPDSAWLPHSEEYAEKSAQAFAVVILVEHARLPEPDNRANDWTKDEVRSVAGMRAAEKIAVLAGHIRCMGFAARDHIAGRSALDLENLAVLSGLAVRTGEGIENRYLRRRFAVAAVSTDYELTPDRPLHADALGATGLRYWWGINGAQSGRVRRLIAASSGDWVKRRIENLAIAEFERPCALVQRGELDYASADLRAVELALHAEKNA